MTSGPVDWRARLAACGFEGAELVPPGFAAHVLRSRREFPAAEAALREQLERQPEDPDALKTLLALLRELGRTHEEAPLRHQLHQWRCRDLGIPEAERGPVLAYLEAADTGSAPPERSADAYVTALFDRYAPGFDDSLRGYLEYRAPERLLEAVHTVLDPMPGAPHGLDVLDLGCGTGLTGPLLRPLARRLEGVDLSPGMLEQARARGVYDALWTGELTAWLAAATSPYHLLVAVDVLVYFGALGPLFTQAARRLAPGGLFALTVEKGHAPGYRLQPSARYAHHLDYVRECAREAGLRPVLEREETLRRQAGQPVRGHVVVLAAGGALSGAGPA